MVRLHVPICRMNLTHGKTATIAEGELPLAPELSPAWGVAGIIMLLTGLVYTLVGIKNRYVHTFLSTAYMTSLGVAVLIVYVMSVPVSHALQGGYVVAVVMAGCAVGAAAIFFKELTEGFGCALGGFCVSMWLLCLVPGGLLRPVPAKAVFIACFTLVGFAFSFSRWTRDWALMVLISFGGATVTVLGIDCFSRAGLKEFWAYVWDVNDNLFPLGANTYPVTKGIRVETAAIIVLFLIGIISQIKLWRIVREKREKRAADRAEGQRNLDEEEENVGREIEEANARERREWERIYGDGTTASVTDSRVTDFGDTGSEKRLNVLNHVRSVKPKASDEAIELTEMSESDASRQGAGALMAADSAEEGAVTVRVAADDLPGSPFEDRVDDVKEKGDEVQVASQRHSYGSYTSNKRNSKRSSVPQNATEAPEVVPLPFSVPQEGEARSDGDRSSVATFADEREEPTSPSLPKRASLAKRLSQGSATLLRSFSQRSVRTDNSEASPEAGESREGLIAEPSPRRPRDDEASLAATIDGESLSGADALSEPGNEEPSRSIEIKPELSKQIANAASQDITRSRPASRASVPTVGANKCVEDVENASSGHEAPETSEKQKSVISVASTRASLTRDRLPRSLSKVAMSYRTNEWAKHLSNADCPDPEDVQVAASRPAKKPTKERSAPVNVAELRKTAEDGAPEPAIRRSDSQMSQVSQSTHKSTRASKPEVAPASIVVPTVSQSQSPDTGAVSPPGGQQPFRRSSSMTLRHPPSTFAPIVEERDDGPETIMEEDGEGEAGIQEKRRSVSNHSLQSTREPTVSPSPVPTIPGVISYSSPQTLLGQREMVLRSRSQGNLQYPEPAFANNSGPGSDSGSIYNQPAYSPVLSAADADDVPLSQRRDLIRQNSLLSLSNSQANLLAHSQNSQLALSHSQSAMSLPRSNTAFSNNDTAAFDSHQPQRNSGLPSQAARESKLASFRQSVQQDLRSGTPIMMSNGRETPFRNSALLGGREAEVQRNIDMQRNVMLGQKEAEAQRKEMQRVEKEWADRAFDERMRNSDMQGAHREVLRKMQRGARS